MFHNLLPQSVGNSMLRVGLGSVCLLIGTLAGCEANPLIQGKPAPRPARVADPGAVPVAGEAQVPAQPGDQDAAAPDRPAPKTPLARGLTELLDSNPALEDDVKGPLREQLQQADDILSSVKSQNRAVLREVNRQQRSRRADSPNVMMIIADRLGMTDLGCYGSSQIKTPYIDQIAKQGTRLTQFYTGSPDPLAASWCLATGRRPDEASWSNGVPLLLSEHLTFAEAMWQAGYTTGLFGNWGVSGVQGPATPADQGFDEWLGEFGPFDQPEHYPANLLQNGKPLKLTKNAEGERQQLAQEFYVSEANSFMERHYRQRPMFIQVYLTTEPLPHEADRRDAISRLDQDVGQLLKKLDELKQFSNTIFIVTSATAAWPLSELQATAALRSGPGELYEGGLRVPLIICGTKRIPAGESAIVSAAWDLAPTVYDLVGAQKRPVAKAGQSLRKFIQPNSQLPTRFLYWEAKHGTSEIAARWQNWKVVRHAEDPAFELYDLATDPREKHDVAAQHPDVIAEIQKRISPSTEQSMR